MKEQFNKIKDLIVKKSEKNNKKTIENLVFIVVILIITIVVINYIWKGGKNNTTQNKDNSYTKLAESYELNTDTEQLTNIDGDLEKKLEAILSNMEGIGKAKVLITYSRSNQIVPLYNEDMQINTTEEIDKEGGKRTINENKEKKDIIYQEKRRGEGTYYSKYN